MQKAQVIIGPFQRPAFREGLMRRISKNEIFSVSQGSREDVLTHLEESFTPLVYIADAHFGDSSMSDIQDDQSLTVVWIEDEGRDVAVSLKDVDAGRLAAILRAAIDRPVMRLAGAVASSLCSLLVAVPPLRSAWTELS